MNKTKKTRAKAKNKSLNNAPQGATSDLNKKDEYSITARINDQIYTCKTDNLDTAIQELGLNIKNVETRMLLTIEKGGKRFEKLLFVFTTRQIFRNKMARKVFINRLILK